MPELPEVETMVHDLRSRVSGRRIVHAEVHWDRIIGFPSVSEFIARLSGRTITTVERRGKFALLGLSDAGVLAIHRGMSGSLLLRQSGEADDRFVRARLRLDEGTELHLDDARKFGRLYLVEGDSTFVAPWLRLGPEPLSPEFTDEALGTRLRGRRAAIKTVLLNQRVVAGIGNIYADEALFRAGIHPSRAAGSLRDPEVAALREAIARVLEGAISRRGTTFSSYRDVDGAEGHNQSQLMVFQRQPGPCLRCGGEVRRVVLGGRGTHFCMKCQPVKAN